MSQVIDLLSQQHVHVLQRIACDRGHLDDPRVAAELLDFLASDVVAHFRLEEDVLFPELAKVPAIANGPLLVMNAEHDTFRDLLGSGQEALAQGDSRRLSVLAADLAAFLPAHIAKEDGVLFPMALELLSEEQLRAIDRTERQPD